MNQSGPYNQQAPYNGGNQQQYYQQTQQPGGWNGAPPQQFQQPYQGNDAKMGLAPDGYQGERFAPEKPKFNDIIFAILFLLVFGGYVAVSVISLRGFSARSAASISAGGTGIGATLNGQTAVILMFCAGVSLILSIFYIFLVRTFPKFILEATLILSVLTTVAYCVYLWVAGQTGGAIVMTIFAVLAIVSYWFMRKRIPLAKIILVSVIRAADNYKSVYVMALFFLVIQTAWSVWTAWTLVAVYQRFTPGAEGSGSGSSSASVTGLIVLVVFAYYWTSELIKAVAYTSTAGVFGTWYYSATKPAHAALSSLKRCLTYSFGSLCFGSLILALLDIIRALLQILQQQANQDGDMVGAALACVAGCLVGCIDWAITFFNRLAYTNIALYGNSFVKASKETWHLVKAKGIDALVNDCLVNNVWTFGSYAIGLLSGIAAYSWLYITNPSYVQDNSSYYSVIILFAVGLGINIALALGSGAIGSGVTTMFVCLAEDPQVVAQRDPQLFEALRQAYPQVVHAVDHS